jgi:uncharacterized damage-inducible protein DinB
MGAAGIVTPKKVQKLAWTCKSDGGYIADIYLTVGEPEGELQITLPDGRTWATRMDLNEIVIFAADHQLHHRALVELYLDEMALNAVAALAPRIH